MMKTYKEYKKQREKEFAELPIFWAFSKKQFIEAMNERGLKETDTDQIYTLGNGGYYLRNDGEVIRNYFAKSDELLELMKDEKFAYTAFYEEMCNHEYVINTYQGDFDVLRCFYNIKWLGDEANYLDYFSSMDTPMSIVKIYHSARKKYLKDAADNEWY